MTRTVFSSSVLEFDRSDPFNQTRTLSEDVGSEDSVVLAVERFSLGTNNLGYALLGDFLRSWDAYPSTTPGWGRVPAWGSARVLAAPSSVADVGTVVTGYLPMATHAAVHATPITSGLLTTDEPRAGMLPIYRRLTSAVVGAQWGEHELDVDAVMTAVFPFAALLARDLRDTQQVVVSSASSRSAAALGRLLSTSGTKVTGLTSARNKAAVDSLGVYEQVLTYDDLAGLRVFEDAVYVDFAGADDVSSAIRECLGDHLRETVVVGGTHLRSSPSFDEMGPDVTAFNTGDREVEVAAELGHDGVEQLYRDARLDLVDWASPWLRVTTKHGLAAADQTWRDIAAGRSDPLSAVVIRP